MLHLTSAAPAAVKHNISGSLLRDLAKQGGTRYDPARAGTIFL